MNRSELHQLTENRVRDAEALLDAGQWSGAYYLAGYAIECALKACIAKMTVEHDFPSKELVLKAYTHKIETLVEAADLKLHRETDRASNAALGANWLIVKDWDEKSRYQQWNESQARELYEAINDSTNGVLQWIKGHW